MNPITVTRRDGTVFTTMVDTLAFDLHCAVVHRGSDEVIIVLPGEDDAGIWEEVPRHHVEEEITYYEGKIPTKGTIIYILEQTTTDPLTYILLPEGCRFPTVASPHEVIESKT